MIARSHEVGPELQDAIAELQSMILARFPDAVFEALENDDPPGIYLRVTVDIDDTDEVMDTIIGRLVDMQVDEGLPIYPVIVRPLHRIAAELDARSR